MKPIHFVISIKKKDLVVMPINHDHGAKKKAIPNKAVAR